MFAKKVGSGPCTQFRIQPDRHPPSSESITDFSARLKSEFWLLMYLLFIWRGTQWFWCGQIHYKGHWKEWALKIKTFGPRNGCERSECQKSVQIVYYVGMVKFGSTTYGALWEDQFRPFLLFCCGNCIKFKSCQYLESTVCHQSVPLCTLQFPVDF